MGWSPASCSKRGRGCTADYTECGFGITPAGQHDRERFNGQSDSFAVDCRSGPLARATLALTVVTGTIARARSPPVAVASLRLVAMIDARD